MVCGHRLGEPEPSGLPARCPWRVLGERAVAHGGPGIEELCDSLIARIGARDNWGGNRNDAGPLDLALGIERGEIGILEDIAVDRQRDALLDLADESAAAPRSAA